MQRRIFLSSAVLCVLLSFVVLVEAESSIWLQTYGGADGDSGYSIVETSDGGYAIAGVTHSFGAGMDDFWLVKIDVFGSMEWNRTYGGTAHDEANSLVATSDGGYAIVGRTRSYGDHVGDVVYANCLLVKTDEFGNMEWNKTYGGLDTDEGTSLIATSDGGYAIAGISLSFGAGDADFWLVKIDADGNMEWNRTYGGTNTDLVESLVATSDGGYAMAGETVAAGIVDFLVVKTDEFGNEEWNRTYGGPYNEHAYALVATSDGGYAIAGSKYGDCWLVKTDASGNMEWNRTYGRESTDRAHSVVVTPDGGYAIAGYTEYSGPGSGAGYSDFWLIKTDESGNMELNQTYGGAGYDVARALIAMSDGGYAIAGYTDSFGAGGYDVLVVRSDEYGVFPEYSSLLLPSLLLVATSIILVYRRKLLKSSSQTKKCLGEDWVE